MKVKLHKVIDTDLCCAQIYFSIINENNIEEFHVVYVEDIEPELLDTEEIRYQLNCALCSGALEEEWYYSLEEAIDDNAHDYVFHGYEDIVTGLEGQELDI